MDCISCRYTHKNVSACPEGIVTRYRDQPARPELGRKAAAEGEQQSWRALEPDPAAKEGPRQARLLAQEPQPCVAVGDHPQIGLAVMAVRNLERAVADDDRRL